MTSEGRVMDRDGTESGIELDYITASEYDASSEANRILERLLDKKIDLKNFREYIETKVEELTEFVLFKTDELELQGQAESLFEDMAWKLAEVEDKVTCLVRMCSEFYNEKNTGKGVSQKDFSDLKELLVERAKVITERAGLIGEQMWVRLKDNVESSLKEDDIKQTKSLVSVAKVHLSNTSSEENFDERKQILDEIESIIYEVLEHGQLMRRYTGNIEKLEDLRDLSIEIEKGSTFFAQYISSLRTDLEEVWKSYTGEGEKSTLEKVWKSCAGESEKSTLNDSNEVRKLMSEGLNTSSTSKFEVGSTYIEWLDIFFRKALTRISREINNIEHLAKNHELLAMSSILDILCSLTPSFTRRFNIFISSRLETSIEDVVGLYRMCTKFSIEIENMIMKFLDGKVQVEDFISSNVFHNYSEFLFGCFIEYQNNFTENEASSLVRFMQELGSTIEEKERGSSTLQRAEFSSLVFKVFDETHKSVSRCIYMTQSLAIYAIVPYLDSFLEKAFFKIFNAVHNFQQTEPSERINLARGVINLTPNLKEYLTKKRKPTQVRVQFLRILENLDFCVAFCSNLNKLSELITEDKIVSSKLSPSNLQESINNPELSITASYILYTQTSLKDNIAELRNIITANTQLWMENPNTSHACSEASRSLFKLASESLSSVISLSQKSLLENLTKPIEDSLMELGNEPDGTIFDLSEQADFAKSASPSLGAIQIGEYLLTLPLYLDPHLSNRALSFSLDTLPISDNILKDYKPLRPPEKHTDDVCAIGDENYSLSYWIRAIISLTAEKFEQVASEASALTTDGTHALSESDTKYLDNVVESLDSELTGLFTRIIERINRRKENVIT